MERFFGIPASEELLSIRDIHKSICAWSTLRRLLTDIVCVSRNYYYCTRWQLQAPTCVQLAVTPLVYVSSSKRGDDEEIRDMISRDNNVVIAFLYSYSSKGIFLWKLFSSIPDKWVLIVIAAAHEESFIVALDGVRWTTNSWDFHCVFENYGIFGLDPFWMGRYTHWSRVF